MFHISFSRFYSLCPFGFSLCARFLRKSYSIHLNFIKTWLARSCMFVRLCLTSNINYVYTKNLFRPTFHLSKHNSDENKFCIHVIHVGCLVKEYKAITEQFHIWNVKNQIFHLICRKIPQNIEQAGIQVCIHVKQKQMKWNEKLHYELNPVKFLCIKKTQSNIFF